MQFFPRKTSFSSFLVYIGTFFAIKRSQDKFGYAQWIIYVPHTLRKNLSNFKGLQPLFHIWLTQQVKKISFGQQMFLIVFRVQFWPKKLCQLISKILRVLVAISKLFEKFIILINIEMRFRTYKHVFSFVHAIL